MNLLNSKKGQTENYLAVVIVLFTFVFFSMLGTVLFLRFKTAFIDAGLYVGVIESTGESFLAAFQMYDYITVIVMIVLIIGVALTSFKLNTAPAFFIVTLIMGVFLGYVSYFFSYMFIQIISEDAFDAVLIMFPRSILICTNLHWIGLVAMVIGSITLYAKRESPGSQFVG